MKNIKELNKTFTEIREETELQLKKPCLWLNAFLLWTSNTVYNSGFSTLHKSILSFKKTQCRILSFIHRFRRFKTN